MVQKQIIIDFDLPEINSLEELISHVAYSCGRPLKAIAADMDWSPTQLSQYLSDRNFPAKKLPDFIQATAPKGHEIVAWLVSKFLAPENPKEKAARVIGTIGPLLPDLLRALEELKK